MHTLVIHLAERQHGVFGRRQLLAGGVGEDNVDSLLRSGRILRVSRGVYRLAGTPLTGEGEMFAATLRCGPDAVVAGERVMAMLRITSASPEGPFTVLTRPGREVTGIDWPWRTDPLVGLHRASVVDIPSVNPARNLLEVAVDGSEAQLERLADGCRWAGYMAAVEAMCEEHRTHPGAARLLDSGLIGAGAAESPPERHSLSFLVEMGAKPQRWITPAIRVDFVFEPAKLVVEYYGGLHFGPKRQEYDAGREAAIRALGYGLIPLDKVALRDLAAVRHRVELVLDALAS